MAHRDLTATTRRFWKLVVPKAPALSPFSAFAGEYFLAPDSAGDRQWILYFPSKAGFTTWRLVVEPGTDGWQTIRISVHGRMEGPTWTCRVVGDLDTVQCELAATLAAPAEEWPAAVTVSPFNIATQPRFDIPAPPRVVSNVFTTLADPLPSGMTLCDCIGCGVEKWELTITGITDAFCDECEKFNVPTGSGEEKAYLVRSPDNCTSFYEYEGTICGGLTRAILTIGLQEDCKLGIFLGIETVGDSPGWTKSGIEQGECLHKHTLDEYVPPPGSFELCDWENATVKIKPVLPEDAHDFNFFADCINVSPCATPKCAEPSLKDLLGIEFPAECGCKKCKKNCACAGCGADSGDGHEPEPPGIQSQAGAASMSVNVAMGNLSMTMGSPSAGPLASDFSLTLNTSPVFDALSSLASQNVSPIDDNTADVTHCDGARNRFICKEEDEEEGLLSGGGLYKATGGSPNSLRQNGDGSWTETTPKGAKFEYAAPLGSGSDKGLLASISDAAGKTWTLNRTGERLDSITDPYGLRTTLTYDGSGHLSGVIDPYNRTTGYQFDVTGKLRSHITPDSRRTTLVYDGTRPAALIDPQGHRTSISYDADGWVTDIENPLGETTHYGYTSYEKTHVTEPGGDVTEVTHDAYRRVTAITNPLDQTREWTYDQGLVKTFKDALGNVTTSTYTDLPNRTRGLVQVENPIGARTTFLYDGTFAKAMIDPMGARTTYVRDTNGQPTAVINPLGLRASTLYDTEGLPKATITPLGFRTTNLYNDRGQTKATINPLGHRTTFSYDNGQLHTIRNPINAVTTMVHDDMNRVTATVNPLGHRWTTTYDANSRPVGSITPTNARTTNVYDATGAQIATINPLGFRASTVYDADQHAVASIDALGNRTTFVHDDAGRTVARVNSLGNRWTTSYDPAGRAVASENPLGFRTTQTYDPASRQVATINALGQRTTLTYDLADRRLATIDPLNNRSTNVYNAAGWRTATVNGLGNRWTTLYDNDGRGVASRDPLNYRTTTVYDVASQTIARINALGNRWSTVYDTAGRTIGAVDPLLNRSTTLYDAANQVTASINPLGFRSTNVYDPAGRATAFVNALGDRSTTVYDQASQSIATVDARNNRWSTLYDNGGRTVASVTPLNHRATTLYDTASQVTATIDPLGYRTTLAYDTAGQQVRLQNARGYITTSLYDPVGRPFATIDSLQNRTTALYDPAGRSVGTINSLGYRNTTVYDRASQPIARIDALGHRSTMLYDAAGRSQAAINALNYRTTTVYDAASKVTATVNALGFRTSFAYDTSGRQTRVTDANVHHTTTIYDRASQPIAVQNALGYRTTTVYDANGQTRALKDANGGLNTFNYDPTGHRTQLIDPLARRTTFGYDASGRQTLRIDARTYLTSYIYDARDSLLGRRYPDGSRHTFSYDPVGNRTKQIDLTGRYTQTWDALNREHVQTYPTLRRTTLAYDPLGRQSAMDNPAGGHFTYAYDATDNCRLIIDPDAHRITLSYDALSRNTAQRNFNDTRTSTTYDAGNQTSRIVHLTPTLTTMLSLDYRYDASGNPVAMWENDGSRTTWTYDNTNQLISERRTATHQYHNTFTWDALGNRLVKNSMGDRTTGTYDLANQIIYTDDTSGRATYIFDPAGNQKIRRAAIGTWTTNVWDFENQVTAIQNSDGTCVTINYDSNFKQEKVQSAGDISRSYWNREIVLVDTDGSEVVKAFYTSIPAPYGLIIAERQLLVDISHHSDLLGSTRLLTTASGVQTDSFLPAAFGDSIWRDGTTPTPFLWAGAIGYMYHPDTSLYYARRRMYTVAASRWLSVDPMSTGSLLDAHLIMTRTLEYPFLPTADRNVYRYALNAPLTLVDPSGLQAAFPSPPAFQVTRSGPFAGPGRSADRQSRQCATTITARIATTFYDNVTPSRWTAQERRAWRQAATAVIERIWNKCAFRSSDPNCCLCRDGVNVFVHPVWLDSQSPSASATVGFERPPNVLSRRQGNSLILFREDVALRDIMWPGPAGHDISSSQYTVAHEFGHLLGVGHPGFYHNPPRFGPDQYAPPDPTQPTGIDPEAFSIMGIGNDMTRAVCERAFARYFDSAETRCGGPWMAHLR